jgi:hypothetical protein
MLGRWDVGMLSVLPPESFKGKNILTTVKKPAVKVPATTVLGAGQNLENQGAFFVQTQLFGHSPATAIYKPEQSPSRSAPFSPTDQPATK